ncbi:chemotaxis protein CheY [Pseudobdellovibrio exovorus]|uniref:Protein containing CheY-like receiver n=1 Tax=Pseudobdellovibrio exovorus JSS TaxID=1184267 RepID=M4V7K5_9BACT|nr:chemotaxis protein CheY [Pseudobdellovibrio exovorus]AGH95193.1 protein containing CheY-like receiver [Pseudobdellovibrio exovorus JSS]
MDRVLLIVDDIQYCRHLEMTLRKVGFEIESMNSEFNLNETVLTFNPDYIICRGNSNRLSALNIAKKLKESNTRQSAKVILVFPEDFNIPAEDLIKLKMDILLFEPISTLRITISLFSLTGGDVEFAKDKLLKFAITDSQFRNYEQQLLMSAGVTLDSEIEAISEMRQFSLGKEEEPIQTEPPQVTPQIDEEFVYVTGKAGVVPEESQLIRTAEQDKLNEEITNVSGGLAAKIDSYNQAINNLDQDLRHGLKKRQTKTIGNQLHKDLIAEGKADKDSIEELDAERKRFANALFKK